MSLPTVTVVIPTYNRPERLQRCLDSLNAQDYPPDSFDVIVVNDGGATSFDNLPDNSPYRFPLQKLTIENSGPATARNYGARLSTGEYIAFTDDDCEVYPDWLTKAVEAMQAQNVEAIGGKMVNAYPNSVSAETWQVYIDYLQTKLCTSDGDPLLLPSNNIIYHRETFLKIGGFRESFPLPAAEDFELGYRIFGSGLRQGYSSTMQVLHHHRATPLGYLNQHYRYGRGAYYLRQVMATDETLQRVQVMARPKGQFYIDLVRHLQTLRVPFAMWILIFLTPIVHFIGRMRETAFPLTPMD